MVGWLAAGPSTELAFLALSTGALQMGGEGWQLDGSG